MKRIQNFSSRTLTLKIVSNALQNLFNNLADCDLIIQTR